MSEARDQSLPPPPSDVPQPADGEAPPAEAPPPVQATDPAHDGPSSKQQLLDLEGMEIDADKVYIPSYFRRKQTALDHADFSAITLASLQVRPGAPRVMMAFASPSCAPRFCLLNEGALATVCARCKFRGNLGTLLVTMAIIKRPPGKNKHHPQASGIS